MTKQISDKHYQQQIDSSHDQSPFSTVESVYGYAEGIDNTLGMKQIQIKDIFY